MFATAVTLCLGCAERLDVKRLAIFALRPLTQSWEAKKLISSYVSRAAKNAMNLGDLVDLEDQSPKEQCT